MMHITFLQPASQLIGFFEGMFKFKTTHRTKSELAQSNLQDAKHLKHMIPKG